MTQQVFDDRTRAIIRNLKPDRRAETPREQLPFQGQGQIVDILVQLQIGIARYPELVATGGAHTREKLADMLVDDRREQYVMIAAAGQLVGKAHHPGQGARRRHHRQRHLAAEGILAFQRYDEVQALVDQTREGMRRIEPDRRQHRQHLLAEILLDPLRLRHAQLVALQKADILSRQRRQQVLIENPVLTLDCRVADLRNLLQDIFGETAVRTKRTLQRQLLQQSGNPDLEEFVEIPAENQQEIQSLQQRMQRIHRLFQHAQVEIENAEFAVDEQLGTVQVDNVFLIHERNPENPARQ